MPYISRTGRHEREVTECIQGYFPFHKFMFYSLCLCVCSIIKLSSFEMFYPCLGSKLKVTLLKKKKKNEIAWRNLKHVVVT